MCAAVRSVNGENPDSFTAARMPNKTMGRAIEQESLRGVMAIFCVLFNLSTMPLA